MMENQVKLTKLAQCAGCGAKVGAGTLAQLLEGIRVHSDPNLLVGFDQERRRVGLPRVGRARARADGGLLPADRG